MINQLCKFLYDSNEREAAITLLNALARHSDTAPQLEEIAKTYLSMKEYQEALTTTEKLLEYIRDPGEVYAAQMNRINILCHLNRPDDALLQIAMIEPLVPHDRNRELKKAYALFLNGERKEAEKILKEQYETPNIDNQTKKEISFNLGIHDLYAGNFKSGIKRIITGGRNMGVWKSPELPFNPWSGENIEGKTLIVYGDGGIGDEVINVRFMRNLQERKINTFWYTDREDLKTVFIQSGIKCFDSSTGIKSFNDVFWCRGMDLPVLLNIEPNKELWTEPYLKAEERNLPIIDAVSCKKVGLRWRGSPHYEQDLHRSIPLVDLYKSLNTNNKYFSLQRDIGYEELTEDFDIVDLYKHNYLDDLVSTTAAIAKLDVIVTSCTSIAHISAALGKETIVIVPISAYHTWCHPTEKSPWYGDTVTVLRQTKPNSWVEPLQQLEKLL